MSEALRSHDFLGACCPEMREALRHSPDSSRITESVLYLAVERHAVLGVGPAGESGPAMLCCPFCGKRLQAN
ncbi:MAG TPA: hypothetical protein V6C52_03980 [Coleofasciculaceae cyanobacterium]|jgi:hypothetical protein